MYNSIYPTYASPYLGVNNRQIRRKQDEEKQSQSSQNAENNLEQQEKKHQQTNNNSYFPNGEKVAIDYTRRHIGIDQVLSDFRNTANAIGAPDEIKAEVQSYLTLIENQAQKNSPNAQIIQSNLKSASQILDEYITNTLKKPSKVVENWVDALFLHHIDYKSEIKQNNISEEVQEIQKEETEIPESDKTNTIKSKNKDDIYIPSDQQLKRMFIKAKKFAEIDSKEKALTAFQNTLEYANEIGDYQTCAMIHYEEGKIYDDLNLVEDALYNFDRAAKQTENNNIKARAHISMGKIYDDYINFAPAVDHYCAAVSFAGEADNLKLQTKALTDLAQIHTGRYDKKNAYMFMDLANVTADETNNTKFKGLVSSKNAALCQKFDDNAKALYLYGNSAKAFSLINDNENLAKNYENAAEIMINYGNPAKAKKLLSKAYIASQKTNNNELKMQITQKLASL